MRFVPQNKRNWIRSNSHGALAKSSTESLFSEKLLSTDTQYPTGRTCWKVYELSHHETPPQWWLGDVRPLNDCSILSWRWFPFILSYSSFTHNIIVYCCTDSFILTTHYCSNCSSIIPTLSCVNSFFKNLSSLGNLRYRSYVWSIMATLV